MPNFCVEKDPVFTYYVTAQARREDIIFNFSMRTGMKNGSIFSILYYHVNHIDNSHIRKLNASTPCLSHN